MRLFLANRLHRRVAEVHPHGDDAGRLLLTRRQIRDIRRRLGGEPDVGEWRISPIAPTGSHPQDFIAELISRYR